MLYLILVQIVLTIPNPVPQQKAYEQCGGANYKGSTSCAAGSICKKKNEYYSQCLPGSSSGSVTPPGSGTISGSSGSQNRAKSVPNALPPKPPVKI